MSAQVRLCKNGCGRSARPGATECNACRSRRWRTDNPDKKREGNRRWRTENLDKEREYERKWRAENRDEIREYDRAWYAANTEKVLASQAAYRAATPEKVRALSAKRRASILTAQCDCCTPKDFERIYGIAALIGGEVDHIRPLSEGGAHCTKNMQILQPEEHRKKTAIEAAFTRPGTQQAPEGTRGGQNDESKRF